MKDLLVGVVIRDLLLLLLDLSDQLLCLEEEWEEESEEERGGGVKPMKMSDFQVIFFPLKSQYVEWRQCSTSSLWVVMM